MKEIIREFFGFGELGYTREPEGYMSWQHLTFVTALMIIMVVAAVYFGRKMRHRVDREKNRVLIWTAILIDGFERVHIQHARLDARAILGVLPLFLCSIQLITIPLAAFTTGRLKEASLDFVSIFGLLGAVLGTYLAGNNYSAYPVISFTNVVSGITHSLSGFAALYIIISGMASMKKRNIPITYAILSGFAVAAYLVNMIDDYNYMFLMRGDGTPYDIIYNLVGGNQIAYPIIVVLLFFVYILLFNVVFTLVKNRAEAKRSEKEEVTV